jgi:hypothetical protein
MWDVPPLETVESSLQAFIDTHSIPGTDQTANWRNLRSDLIDLINRRAVYDPNAHMVDCLNRIRKAKGFGQHVPDIDLV